MAKNLVFNLDLYKLPLSEILQNHRKFYGLRRDHGEPMNRWLKRIQRCIHRCEFSPITAEFLTIDQFLCGLTSDELNSIQSVNESWTLKQLLEYVLNGNTAAGHIEANSAASDTFNRNQNISLDVVKPEPIEYDPLSGLADETNVLVKTDEEFHPAQNTSIGGNAIYEVHEYIPQNEFEISVCNSMPASEFFNSGLRGQIDSCKDPACYSVRSKLKEKCIQQEQKLKKIHQDLGAHEPIPCTSTAGIFSKFDSVFTKDELDKLRQIGPNRKEDSTFILHAVRFLYKNDMGKLSELSLTGRSMGSRKEKMSSTQYDLFKRLFRKRLKSLSLYAEEFTDRQKKMNKHIKNAIINLSRKSKHLVDV